MCSIRFLQVNAIHWVLIRDEYVLKYIFCTLLRRHRDHKPESPEFTADVNTAKVENGHLSTVCKNTKNNIMFSLDLYLLKDNRFRFRFNELNPLRTRYEVRDVIIDALDQEK